MVDVILHPLRAAYGRHDVDLRPGYVAGQNQSAIPRSSGDLDLFLREPIPVDSLSVRTQRDVALYGGQDFVEPVEFSTHSGYVRAWVDRRKPNIESNLIRNLRFTASLLDTPGHLIEAHEARSQLAVARDPFVPRVYKDDTFATRRDVGPRGRGSALKTVTGGNTAITLGDLVSFGDDSLGEFPRNGTVSFWIRMAPGQADNALLMFGSISELEFLWVRFIVGFPAITIFSATNGTLNTVGTLITVADGAWHHVVCGADRDGEGTYFFYVDGVRGTNLVVEGSDDAQWLRGLAPADPFAPMPTALFAYTGYATVDQSVSDLHIWQGRVLNESEVKSLYADPDQLYAKRHVAFPITPPRQIDVSLAVKASRATTATNLRADRVLDVQGASKWTVSARRATASITADRVIPAAISAQAARATCAIAADLIRAADVAAQASTATVTITADLIHTASITAQAEQVDSTGITADRVIVADTQADATTATATITAAKTIDAAIAGQAQTATADIVAVFAVQAAIAAQASRATASIDSTRISTAALSAQAPTATTSLTATRVIESSISAQASTASTTIAAEIAGSVGADASFEASRATASLTGQVVHEASVAAQASRAQVTLSVDLVHPATITAVASRAQASLDATKIAVQGEIAAQAGNAAASVAGTRVIQAQIQAQAQTATASVLAQVVREAAVTAQSGTAQAQIQAARVRDGALALQASRALLLTDADLIHQLVLAASASTATCSISGDPLTSAACALLAERATANVSATRIVTGTIDATASNATALLAAGQQSQGGVDAQAETAQVDITATRVVEASLDLQASTATVLLFDYSRTRGAQAIMLVAPFFRRVLEVGYVPHILFKPGTITIESPHAVPARFLAPITSG